MLRQNKLYHLAWLMVRWAAGGGGGVNHDERDTLRRWARRASSSPALAQRCRIVLGCAAGKSNKEVAAEVGLWPLAAAVIARRLEGLADKPRLGVSRRIGDEQVEEVMVATLERQPKDATHWSRASMAAETRGCPSRRWAGSGKPSAQGASERHVQFSNDPQLIDKVCDVVGRYLDPPTRRCHLSNTHADHWTWPRGSCHRWRCQGYAR